MVELAQKSVPLHSDPSERPCADGPGRPRRSTAALLLFPVVALALAADVRAEEPAESAAPPSVDSYTPAEWLGAANEALLPDDSMVAEARILTRDGFGGERALRLDMVRVSEEDGVRTLVEVRPPPEDASAPYVSASVGTTLEIFAPVDGSLRRHVWLPALRRLRTITGTQRTDHFLGTEFTYEDLGLAMPVERGHGESFWMGPEGRVVLESPSYHYYDRVVTRIDPKTKLPTRVSYYDEAGQLFRETFFEEVEVIDGHPFPTRITVHDRITDARSTLVFDSVRFGVDVSTDLFRSSEVRRRLAVEDPVPDPGETKPGP